MSEYVNLDYDSPFQPSTPVKPELFKGREEIIKKILRYFNKILKNEVQHFFLTGNKGMGKTSIAEFITNEVLEFNIATVYLSNKDNNSVENLASRIVQEIINQYPTESRKKKIEKWFGKYVTEIEIVGAKLKFDLDEDKKAEIRENFLNYLNIAWEELKDKYNGMFIIIDDINGLSETKEFVDWYKRIADTVAVNKNYSLPIYFILEGYPEKFDNLVELDRSFGRIFHYANLEELEPDEIKEFYNNTFKTVNMEIDEKSLNLMIEYSSGIPLTMQYIGDSVFWNADKNKVSIKNVKEGIISAGYEIGDKQLRRILKQIENPLYNEIFMKISKEKLVKFNKNQLQSILTRKEYDNVPEFIEKMKKINIIEKVSYFEDEEYIITDKLFMSYYYIKSFEKEYNSIP